MSHRQSAAPAARHTRAERPRRKGRAVYYRGRVRRRRTALLIAAVTVVVVRLALGGAGADPATGNASASGRPRLGSRAIASAAGGQRGTYRARAVWTQQGQAALVLGNGLPSASPDEQPVPIASVAKVMTAYLVLKHFPLNAGQDGFTVTITPADVQTEARDVATDQSVAAVRAGEQLSERQLLEELLIPSGNNIALLLGARVAGSDTGFVDEMNAEARALGMYHTTYTDPSGWDAGTVSTAADQLRLFRQAMRLSVFRQIVSMPSATLPVAGTLVSTNPLVDDGYFGKTGSDTAAGACLAFFTHVIVGGRSLTAAGVVLGQWYDGAVSLAAAGQAAQQLVASATGGQQQVGTTAPQAGTVVRQPGAGRQPPGGSL